MMRSALLVLLLACTGSDPVPVAEPSVGPVTPWVPPACYARSTAEAPRNPCFACHQRGRRPHTLDDSNLQAVYDLQAPARTNGWSNLFADRSAAVAAISDDAIDAWVRSSNQPPPEQAWGACFDFDADGWDRCNGVDTGWRAYRWRPFPDFFPTNGNWGDALLRLPAAYRPDRATYAINLAILDAVLQRADIPIPATDEAALGVDLDLDGTLGTATQVTFRFSPTDRPMRWVGGAEPPPTPGLLPEGAEILHSVRYLEPSAPVRMAPRMKELRYMKKTRWLTMADLASGVAAEEKERAAHPDRLEVLVGDAETGLVNGAGWRLFGWIEAQDGTLRRQTTAELAYCIGCHGGVGATTDSTFSPVRKIGWGHSAEMGALPDAKRADGQGEFATWVRESGGWDGLAANTELHAKFSGEGQVLSYENLAVDARVLVLPSVDRARQLNRATKVIVDEQSFLLGRDPVWGLTEEQVLRVVQPNQPTGVTSIVKPGWMR